MTATEAAMTALYIDVDAAALAADPLAALAAGIRNDVERARNHLTDLLERLDKLEAAAAQAKLI